MASVLKVKSSSGKIRWYGKYDAGERTLDGNIAWKKVPTYQGVGKMMCLVDASREEEKLTDESSEV